MTNLTPEQILPIILVFAVPILLILGVARMFRGPQRLRDAEDTRKEAGEVLYGADDECET